MSLFLFLLFFFVVFKSFLCDQIHTGQKSTRQNADWSYTIPKIIHIKIQLY